MVDYNLRMVERLEARWLDPDCVDHCRDDEEMKNRADEEAEERWFERGFNDKQSIS